MPADDDADLFSDDERILLIEQPAVYLLRWRKPDLEDRLADLFRRAWGMLPAAARAVIRCHWQPSPQYPCERIVIKNLGLDANDDAILAETQRQGQRIEFDESAVRRFPDGPLIGLILHELAHVYGHAIGEENHKCEYADEDERKLAEPFVTATLAAWGVSQYEEEEERWLEANPDWYDASADR